MPKATLRRRTALIKRCAFVAAVALMSAGCASYKGVAEFTVYVDSYKAAADLGADILDRVAVGERKLYGYAHPFDPKLTPFDPDVAGYYVTAVDPPATAAYRKTVQAVAAYNEALHGLAGGADAAALAGKITRLSAIGAGAASDLAAIGAAGPTSGGAAGVAAATAVNTVLAGLEPLTAEAFGFAFRERYRERLIDQAPTIRKAIAASRSTTPALFDALRFPLITAADADPARRGQLTAAEAEQIRISNTLLSTWVVLLDASAGALDVAVNAVTRDDGAGSFDGLILASGTLAQAVAAARLNLSGGQ
jgi:hypothetical protein